MKCLNLIGRDQGNNDNEIIVMQHLLLGCYEGSLSAETMADTIYPTTSSSAL